MGPEQKGTYDNFDYLKDNIHVSPEELVVTCQEVIGSDQEFSHEDLSALLLELGIDQPAAVTGELTDSHSVRPQIEMDPRDVLGQGCAFALATLAKTGVIPFQDAHKLVDKEVPDDSTFKGHLKAQLFSMEAMEEHIAGHNKAAIKLIRRSVSHAVRLDPEVLITAKNNEVFILFNSGQYKETIPKAKKLWELLEKTAEDEPSAQNHDQRQSVLRQWRAALSETGQLHAAANINQMMYELGYVAETGEEYRQRLIRDFPEYSHLRD